MHMFSVRCSGGIASGSARTRSVRAALVRAALVPAFFLPALAAIPVALGAQSRTLVVRGAETPFEQEVERLVQDLLQKRRLSVALVGNLQGLQLAMRGEAANEEQKARFEQTLRQVRSRLQLLEADGARIQRRLSEICAADRKPEGWVGIAYSGSASATREDDGRVIMRFVDQPSIESVEPGSPADKAGIRGGDRILSMAGKDLRDAVFDFTPLLRPGTRIAFKLQRGVETKLLQVTVEPRPDDFSTPCPWVDERIAAAFAPMQMAFRFNRQDGEGGTVQFVPNGTRVIVQGGAGSAPSPSSAPTPVTAPNPPLPPSPTPAPTPPLPPVSAFGRLSSGATVTFAGAQLMSVGRELAEALGVERGMLVVGTGRGSPAEQSGLRTGDVVVSVDGQPMTTPMVFLQAVEQATNRELRLQLVRRKKSVSTTLTW